MESPKPYGSPSNPLISLSAFVHQNCLRLGAELASRADETKRFAGALTGNWKATANRARRAAAPPNSPFAWFGQPKPALAATATLGPDHVARTLAGTAVYTVSNSNNEFVLISDPDAAKSIGLLCFRQEDAESFLSQVWRFNFFFVYGKINWDVDVKHWFLGYHNICISPDFLYVKLKLVDCNSCLVTSKTWNAPWMLFVCHDMVNLRLNLQLYALKFTGSVAEKRAEKRG